MQATELENARCVPRKGKEHALDQGQIRTALAIVSGWQLTADGLGIHKQFRFPDFHHTMAFVNAVAWIAHVEDHHPDFKVSYPSCELHFSTHDVGGISLNDFICAAKVERLVAKG
ncbi:MAG: 4a-hydroxytetrahydrobiopterin dehydratase [Dokdonella sp.]|jgi:4a-hydroxytetrahydrobiopterin dehydratase|uniref:4a-hydroxytetrahydrobiopterin dehydratase n=1 Tax=Dokdonella sp. TaxID=2291710 RepID=UPI001B7313EB|nr:4a-hydroxytetrahydrobiopterin dehydratase [Dokdonella sp.]MCC6441046.1 4a-hydroxytetrahydrobiopterin dehydratase [Rhodanobacteraceae bacterium]MBP6327531.1 4a-hydroxytetrahydrobiopterin dehydratase [Dokdonella sp.]HNV09016.1 4a-hydroxytetrahydrobiopterin dehydratase [Dokdonella sp.]HPW03299.1 4a-hydroxytetrahydrobiopterin dehydratase [Dokdonella sp.]HQV49314.1 4a-hydroxytetrahydrobiopterin dehydratase [Dokdonella sp.]